MTDFAAFVTEIQAAVANVPSVVLDRVIGYGSYFWGGHVENESDIDIAVLVTRENGEAVVAVDVHAIERALRDWSNRELFVIDLFEIEKRRTATTGMHGKILARGVPLYVNPETEALRKRAADSAMPFPEARDALVSERQKYAVIMLDRAEKTFLDIARVRFKATTCKLVIESAQAAAVFGLWAALYANDIDPSPRALRWNAERLATIAAMFNADLVKIIPAAKRLPVGRIYDSNRFDFSKRDATRSLNSAREIIAALGIMATSNLEK